MTLFSVGTNPTIGTNRCLGFLSPLTPVESICEYWTTLHSHGLYLSNIGSNLLYFKNVSVLASLHCRCNLGPQWTQQITGNALQISLQPD